jgi:hypothetical protein
MHAAVIGPMVCELDGPTPILNRSKTLATTAELLICRSGGRAWPDMKRSVGIGKKSCTLSAPLTLSEVEGCWHRLQADALRLRPSGPKFILSACLGRQSKDSGRAMLVCCT